jgi:hypothetical protein
MLNRGDAVQKKAFDFVILMPGQRSPVRKRAVSARLHLAIMGKAFEVTLPSIFQIEQ